MSKARPWYKHYPRDFLTGTIGLSLAEVGAYALVLDLIYDRGGPIPDDDHVIAAGIHCHVRTWRRIRKALIALGKLIERGGYLVNKRAETEIATAPHNEIIEENASQTSFKRAFKPSYKGKKSNDFSRDLRIQNPDSLRSPRSLAPEGARSAHSSKTNGQAGEIRSRVLAREEGLAILEKHRATHRKDNDT